MKQHIMMNLMIYVCHSRCKRFSPRPWSKFARFDFSENLYAYHEFGHYETEGVVFTNLLESYEEPPTASLIR